MSNGWTRVEDGLPEEGRTCWTYAENTGAIRVATLTCGSFEQGVPGVGIWRYNPTHWRYADVPESPGAGE